MRRIACSRCVSLVTSNSITSMPVSSVNFFTPFQTPSLKDLSNLPPISKTTAGFKLTVSSLSATSISRLKIITAATTMTPTINKRLFRDIIYLFTYFNPISFSRFSRYPSAESTLFNITSGLGCRNIGIE